MSSNKTPKKVRFFPYLPFGYCSKNATAIEGKQNPYASLFLAGDDPDGLIKLSDNYRRRTLDKAQYLCAKNYAKNIQLACGTPAMKRSFRALTKLGLAVLVEAPDEAAADDAEDPNETSAFNGKIKEDYFRSGSTASTELRETLIETAGTEHQAFFNETLLDAVIEEKLTPFTQAIHLTQATKISVKKYSPNQQYAIWRNSHIQAMFMANGYLTYMDRRPYDTGFAIDGISDEESYQAYIEQYGITLPAFTYKALTEWYKNNPGFYRITQQQPDTSAEAREEWLNTPAFYTIKELPNFNASNTIKYEKKGKGSQQVFNASHIGLAIGKKLNYVIYHGKPGEFKWLPQREKAAMSESEAAVRHMKTQNPDIPCNDTVKMALYFCSSCYQFEALFDRTKKKHESYQKLSYLTKEPYASMYAIPVNDSGTTLLWLLMEFTPSEAERQIHESICNAYPHIETTGNFYYPLVCNEKKVFSGYTMDIMKINNALEDHLDGHDFLIACFPDQIPWYRKLFPGKEFL